MSYFALLAALALPCLFPEDSGQAVAVPPPTAAVTLPPSETVTPTAVPTAVPTVTPTAAPSESTYYIKVKSGEDILDMDMQSYLVGVVAAEMPASFHPEALKAQAVAARTYTLYCKDHSHHTDADICTDHSCCQEYISPETLREVWGESYEENLAAVTAAVEVTDGEYLSFGGQAIFAAFHSSSAGKTEDCGQVWSALPYLVSVDSPESASDVPGYVSRVSCGAIDFRDTVLSAHPEADFSLPREQWVGEITADESGRVSSAVLGGVSVSGIELRGLFSLRSTAFSLEYTDGAFVFTVIGYGHGVGMSQYGANVLALGGYSYTDILAHYYPGTEIER